MVEGAWQDVRTQVGSDFHVVGGLAHRHTGTWQGLLRTCRPFSVHIVLKLESVIEKELF